MGRGVPTTQTHRDGKSGNGCLWQEKGGTEVMAERSRVSFLGEEQVIKRTVVLVA